MPDTSEAFADFADLVPEDAIPIAGWKVALYMTPEGARRCNWDIYGDAPLPDITTTLGCVHWALADWVAQSRSDEEDD